MKIERENYELKLRLPQSWQDPIEDWAACEPRRPTQLVRNIIEDALKARDQEDYTRHQRTNLGGPPITGPQPR